MRYRRDPVRASSNRHIPVEARQRAQVFTDLVFGQANHASETKERKTEESQQGMSIRARVTANTARREVVFKEAETP